MKNTNEQRIDILFERLVPASGKASTVAGEIVRAICRIEFRNQNDGDHIGIGYGRETVNPAARYLMAKCGDEAANAIISAWNIYDDVTYRNRLEKVETAVLNFLDAHPELETEYNEEDFGEYQDKYEDIDDYEDDEDF